MAAVSSEYRSVIIGASGARARHHALAYRHVRRARLVAVSARTAAPRDRLAADFGIPARYDDYREMLDRERPHLVHVNTPPNARLEVLRQVAAAGVPAALVEKPVAIDGPDCAALAAFARTSPLLVAVNHQLHYHAARRRLQDLVAEGALGALQYVDASSGMNAAYQGTHCLQAVFACAGSERPTEVWARVRGADGLQPNPRAHYAPDNLHAMLYYASGLAARLRCGQDAPRLRDAPAEARAKEWAHKRIAVYGDRGHAIWTMWSWETLLDRPPPGAAGRLQGGSHDYWEQDAPAQAALVDSVLDWIERPERGHPLALERAAEEYAVLLAAYRCRLRQRGAVALPEATPEPVIEPLRRALGAAGER